MSDIDWVGVGLLIVLLAIIAFLGMQILHELPEADTFDQAMAEQWGEQTFGDELDEIRTVNGTYHAILHNDTMVRYPGHEDADVQLNVTAGVVG